jgi:hypothetical protein
MKQSILNQIALLACAGVSLVGFSLVNAQEPEGMMLLGFKEQAEKQKEIQEIRKLLRLKLEHKFKEMLMDPSQDFQLRFDTMKKKLGLEKEEIYLFCCQKHPAIIGKIGFQARMGWKTINGRRVIFIKINYPLGELSPILLSGSLKGREKIEFGCDPETLDQCILHELGHIKSNASDMRRQALLFSLMAGGVGLNYALWQKQKVAMFPALSLALLMLPIHGLTMHCNNKYTEKCCDFVGINFQIQEKNMIPLIKRANWFFKRHQEERSSVLKKFIDVHPSDLCRAQYYAQAVVDNFNTLDAPAHAVTHMNKFYHNLEYYYPELHLRAKKKFSAKLSLPVDKPSLKKSHSKSRHLAALVVGSGIIAAGLGAYYFFKNKKTG